MSDKVVVFKLFWLRQASYSELAISIFIFWLAQLCLLTFQQFHFIWRLYSIPPRSESVFIFSHLGKSPFPSTISVLQHYCPHRLEEQKRIIKLMTISLNGCLWKDDCNACHVSFQLLFFFPGIKAQLSKLIRKCKHKILPVNLSRIVTQKETILRLMVGRLSYLVFSYLETVFLGSFCCFCYIVCFSFMRWLCSSLPFLC